MAWTAPKTDFASGNILTAAQMNAIGENLNALTLGRRLGIQERTTDFTVNSATIAGSADIFASDLTWTAVAAAVYVVQFYAPRINAGSGDYVSINLVTGTGTGLANLWTSSSLQTPAFTSYHYTPGAGSISINCRATRNVSNGSINAGSGGSGIFDWAPAYLAVYGPVTTT